MNSEYRRKQEAKEKAAKSLQQTKKRLGIGRPKSACGVPPNPLVATTWERKPKIPPTSDRIPENYEEPNRRLRRTEAFAYLNTQLRSPSRTTAMVAALMREALLPWRGERSLLPARCFTRTASSGRHHLTSISRDDLNAAQDVVSRSTSARTCHVRSH